MWTTACLAPCKASNVFVINSDRACVSTCTVTSSGMRCSSISLRRKSKSWLDADGNPTSMVLKPMATSDEILQGAVGPNYRSFQLSKNEDQAEEGYVTPDCELDVALLVDIICQEERKYLANDRGQTRKNRHNIQKDEHTVAAIPSWQPFRVYLLSRFELCFIFVNVGLLFSLPPAFASRGLLCRRRYF